MAGPKVLKKGEYLFKEGEKIQSVWIVQSGQITLCLQKNKKNVDIMQVGAGYVFADLIILGLPTYNYSGLATAETKVVEVPAENFKLQYESIHQVNKSFIKGLADRLKWTMNEVKTSRFEREPSACPEELVSKVFGSLFHTLNHKGLKDGTSSKIDWMTLRQYTQRMFNEPPRRLEQVTQLLVKLKQAEYIYGRNPDDPESKEEIQAFLLKDMGALEAFFEFYQYYYFKGGKSELLRFDESNYNFLRLLIMSVEGVEPDKFGVVSKDLNEVTEFCKGYGLNLAAGHFTSLEAKGLFCKGNKLQTTKLFYNLKFENLKPRQRSGKFFEKLISGMKKDLSI